MSGKHHVAYRDSKTVSVDKEQIAFSTDPKTSYTMSVREEPLITYNDMAFIPPRNSVVFRAGDPPIWNRNEMILPMSWRLALDTIKVPGKEYSLQTVPTLSSAMDFDLRKNQPYFQGMLEKRIMQAAMVPYAEDVYNQMYRLSDLELERVDPDVYADEIMDIVDSLIEESNNEEIEAVKESISESVSNAEENDELAQEVEQRQKKAEKLHEKIYADGKLSKYDVTHCGRQLELVFIRAFLETRTRLGNDPRFLIDMDGNLSSADGTMFIEHNADIYNESKRALEEAATDADSRVYAESEIQDVPYRVLPEFYEFLASVDVWDFAHGAFEREVVRLWRQVEES
jgi:DNA-binding transcriptional regulator GbsR (MarR family)